MSSCDSFKNPGVWDVGSAILLAFGIMASYIPQQIKIIRRKTLEGLSPYFLVLMNLGATCPFASLLLLSNNLYHCCATEVTLFECGNGAMGLVQTGVACLGPLILITLGAIFARSSREEHEKAMRMLYVVLGFDAIVSILVVLLFRRAQYFQVLANVLGSIALLLGILQYVPQLLTTYKLKHAGTLSIATMLIQMPGGYFWCITLMLRDGANWTAWGSLFAASTLQLVLMLMAAYYTFSNSKSEAATEIEANEPILQREAL